MAPRLPSGVKPSPVPRPSTGINSCASQEQRRGRFWWEGRGKRRRGTCVRQDAPSDIHTKQPRPPFSRETRTIALTNNCILNKSENSTAFSETTASPSGLGQHTETHPTCTCCQRNRGCRRGGEMPR